MNIACNVTRAVSERNTPSHCLARNTDTRSCKTTARRPDEETLLRRILCHLMAELDRNDQTHLKIYVSLAMPTSLRGLAGAESRDQPGEIPFYIDDQRHTLCVSDLGGAGLPQQDNWLATVYLGTAVNGIVMASVSLGSS